MMQQHHDPATPPRQGVAQHVYGPFTPPDPTTPVGRIIARRLREELFIWLTAIDENAVPQPLPVTFLWDEAQATFLIYIRADRGRLADIQRNPNVALHLDTSGGDIIILTGEATVSADDPPSDQVAAWVEKYSALLARLGMSAKQSAESASVPLRIRPLTLTYARNPT